MGNQPSTASTGLVLAAATAASSLGTTFTPLYYAPESTAVQPLPEQQVYAEAVSAVATPDLISFGAHNLVSIPDIDAFPPLTPAQENQMLPWTHNARNPIPEKVLYMVKHRSIPTNLDVTDANAIEAWLSTLTAPTQKKPSVGAAYRHGVGRRGEFSGEYYSLITDSNIDTFVPYGEENWAGGDGVLLIVARDALSEYDYHVNTNDFYGDVVPRNTYYSWELNQFVHDADKARNTYNEVVFHDRLDPSKVLKDVIFARGGILYDRHGKQVGDAQSKWRDVMPRHQVGLTPEEKAATPLPYTLTERPMLPILCHTMDKYVNGHGVYDSNDIVNYDKLKLATCGMDPHAPYDENAHEMHAERIRTDEEERNHQNFPLFIRAWHVLHAPGYMYSQQAFQREFTRGIRISPPATIEGGYYGAYFGVKRL
jgi:hypothetical protein